MTDSSAGRPERGFTPDERIDELAELLADTLECVDEVVARTTEADLESGLHQVLATVDARHAPHTIQSPAPPITTSDAAPLVDPRDVDPHETEHSYEGTEARKQEAEIGRRVTVGSHREWAAAGCGVAVAHTEQASTTTHCPSSRPTILYAGTGVVITTTFFESEGNRYPLQELDYVERVEHGGWLQAVLFELWARFRDQEVRLFHSNDAVVFGQVCRALTQAREHAGLA